MSLHVTEMVRLNQTKGCLIDLNVLKKKQRSSYSSDFAVLVCIWNRDNTMSNSVGVEPIII